MMITGLSGMIELHTRRQDPVIGIVRQHAVAVAARRADADRRSGVKVNTTSTVGIFGPAKMPLEVVKPLTRRSSRSAARRSTRDKLAIYGVAAEAHDAGPTEHDPGRRVPPVRDAGEGQRLRPRVNRTRSRLNGDDDRQPTPTKQLTQVGPGTLMGNLMRQYWMPALAVVGAGADGDPRRVLLLGEKLIAFRDTTAARSCWTTLSASAASLFFGRNEEDGLRCVYHGWKFDVDGNCVDMPNEPAESDFKEKVKATAYPDRERGGVVWAYMGPREKPPPLPDLGAEHAARKRVAASTRSSASATGCRRSKATSTHRTSASCTSARRKPEDAPPGTFQHYVLKDRAPRYEVVDTDYGAMYGAYRPAQPGHLYWRIASFLFPFYAMIPTGCSACRSSPARGCRWTTTTRWW